MPSRTKALETSAPSAGQIRVLQPLHQRQVVGDATQQIHRGVGVQVDQAGNQDVFVELCFFAWQVAFAGFGNGQDGKDLAVVNGNGVIFQNRVLFGGGNPARFQQEIDATGVLVSCVWQAG